jgi:hypothetical protein
MEHDDVSVGTFLPADEDPAEAIHPTVRAFDDPARSAESGATLDGLRLFSASFDVRSEFERGNDFARLRVVVAPCRGTGFDASAVWASAERWESRARTQAFSNTP